jgi:hypothetical protein
MHVQSIQNDTPENTLKHVGAAGYSECCKTSTSLHSVQGECFDLTMNSVSKHTKL